MVPFVPPRRWECPDCFLIVWAPFAPSSCHRCNFQASSPLVSPPFTFKLALPPLGQCIGCGSRGPSGTQCLNCAAPVEPLDQSFHYEFGWRHGPRPDNLGPSHPNAPESPFVGSNNIGFIKCLASQIISALGGIFSDPLCVRTRAVFKLALEALDAGHLNRLLSSQYTDRLNAVSKLVTNHLSETSPRMACIRANITLDQPAALVALLGADSRPSVFNKIISPEGAHLTSQESIMQHIAKLSSWATLRVMTIDRDDTSRIPDPFTSISAIELHSLTNVALHQDSGRRSRLVSDILSSASYPLHDILLGHSMLPNAALRTLSTPDLEALLTSPDLDYSISTITTKFIEGESRRLTILGAFVHLTQPAALLAMILFVENILSFDVLLSSEGVLIGTPNSLLQRVDSIISQARQYVISRPTLSSVDFDTQDDNLSELRDRLLRIYITKKAPELLTPYTAFVQDPPRAPPGLATRELVTKFLGRPLPWEMSVWDGSLPINRESLHSTYGDISWKESYYLLKHFNIRIGGPELCDAPCGECGYGWAFHFSGSCPFCADPPPPSICIKERRARFIRVAWKIGTAAVVLLNLLREIRSASAPANPLPLEIAPPTAQTVHILIMKGYSTLYLLGRDGKADIGFHSNTLEDESVFTAAARIIATETNINARSSDFISLPGVTCAGESVLIYPSIDRDVWVRDTSKYKEVEFVCLNTIVNIGKIFPTHIYFAIMQDISKYIFDDPAAHYRQIMARCPICRSLGPLQSQCSHPSVSWKSLLPPASRLTTAVVGYLQGVQSDCQMCSHSAVDPDPLSVPHNPV